MRAIIIEDEKLSAEYLRDTLMKIDQGIEIVAVIDSIKKSVEAFRKGLAADIIFLDVHLADGLCFDIFKKVEISTPVIFTTAYSDYAIKAFEINSIDYLLKPISIDDVKRALTKFKRMTLLPQRDILIQMAEKYQQMDKPYKQRFLVKIGNTIESIKTDDIAHFNSKEGMTFLVLENGKRYPIDYTLDQLEELIEPKAFFRINRKVILSFGSIIKTNAYLNGRLVIDSNQLKDEASVVSRERVAEFKLWLDK